MGFFSKDDDEVISINTYLEFDDDHCRNCGKSIVNNGVGWACSEECRDKANKKDVKLSGKMKKLTGGRISGTLKQWKKVDSWF